MRLLIAAACAALMLAACSGQSDEPATGTMRAASSSVARADTAPAPVAATAALRSERFGGERIGYRVAVNGAAATVTHVATNVSTVVDEGVQRLVFADGTLVLDIEGKAGTVYRVYQAAFDRKPDSAGYAFWLGIADGGASIDSIAAEFVKSNEFRTLYGATPSNRDLLSRYYQNVLHRAPDPAGFDFWLKALDGGLATPTELLAQFSDSAENKAQVLADIQNGIWVPGPARLAAEMSGGATTAAVGKVLALTLRGSGLDKVTARIGSTPAASQLVDGQLLVTVPEMPAGAYTLTLSGGADTVSLPLAVTETILPAAPRAYLESAIDTQQAQLATALANASGDGKALLQAVSAELARQKARLAASQDEAAIRREALAYAANFAQLRSELASLQFASGPVRRAFNASECQRLAFAYPVEIAGIAASTWVVAASLSNPLTAALGAAALYSYIEVAKATLGLIVRECLFNDSILLSADSDFASATQAGRLARRSANLAVAASSASFVFTHGKARAFAVTEKNRISDMVGDDLKAFAVRMASILGFIQKGASFFGVNLEPYIANFASYSRERTQPGKGGDYVIGTISDARIQGTAGAAGDKLSLGFSFRQGQMPKDPVGFSFTLLRADTKKVMGTYTATLHPAPPQGVDAVFTLRSVTTSTVTPPVVERSFPCSASPTGQCQASIFCAPPSKVGDTETLALRVTLDPEAGRATFYYDEEMVVGTYSMASPTSGVIKVDYVYDEGLVQDGLVKFFGAGGLKLDLTYDTVKRELTGTMLDKSVTKWSLDGTEAVCTASSSITGAELKTD